MVTAAAVPQQLHVLAGGAVEKKQVYFEYAKVQWESDQVSLATLLHFSSMIKLLLFEFCCSSCVGVLSHEVKPVQFAHHSCMCWVAAR
jgi:hypothetical protein